MHNEESKPAVEVEVLDYDTSGEWTIRGKGIMEGAKTLADAAKKAEDFARFLRQMAKDGWKLAMPVMDDYGHCERKKDWLRKHPEHAKKIEERFKRLREE